MSCEHQIALSIHAYYCGEFDAGRRACDRLIAGASPGDKIDAMARGNRLWYQQRLVDIAPCRRVQLAAPVEPGWSLFNPTVAVHGDGLVAIARSSNYAIVDGQYVIPPADSGQIKTQNFLTFLDRDLRQLECHRLADPEYHKTGYEVDGLEDCRLRVLPDSLGVSATVRNVAPYDGRCRIATASLNVDKRQLSDLVVLDGLSCQPHEKNWMPICGTRSWIYAICHDGHTVTVDPDLQTKSCHLLYQRGTAPPLCRDFRGGGQVVPFRGGWLAIVHEVAPWGHTRAYEHRWVWLDNDMQVQRVSDAFALHEFREIEFAAGLAVIDDRVIVSYGVRDAEAWMLETTGDAVWTLLTPI